MGINEMDFLKIETMGKKAFEQFPMIKRSAKRVYQLASVATSGEKFRSEGDVTRVSPDDGWEYFYGYYDKSPWDVGDRYMICIRVKQAYRSVAPKEPGTVGVIDTQDHNRFIPIGTTHAWNVQQSCMAQWLGPDFGTRILYNDFRDGHYCAVIYNFREGREENVLPMAAYDVARNGAFFLSLDFSRLHRLRPGYGYSNLPDATKGKLCPDSCCIWKVDIETGKITELFQYTDFAAFEPDPSMSGAEHKVNHLMISPNGKRFMVLHRWFQKGRKHTRLVTVNVDGTEMYNLSDDVFVSHCYWKNDGEILSFLRKKETGDHYYLMRDRTQEYKLYWPELRTDGHCSYSPDGRFIITDTYPNRKRLASVYLCTEEDNCSRRIARVFAPFRYDNDCRCDLHPRWNRKGDKVCIDSVHGGKRGLYVIPVHEKKLEIINEGQSPMASVIIPCYNAATTLPRTIDSLRQQTFKDFEVILIDDGSQDSTLEVANRIVRESGLKARFESQQNAGVSAARNHGIELAGGKYLCFLDADDVYQRRFLERAIGVCETLKADTVLTYQDRDLDKVMRDAGAVTLDPLVSSMDAFMEHFMYHKENIHFGGLLYRRDIVNRGNLRFTEGTRYGEDLEFAWKYMVNCESGVILHDKMYGYDNNPSSAVNTVRWEKTNLVDAMLRVKSYMGEKNCGFENRFSDYFLPRTVWTTAKTFAKGKRMEDYRAFIRLYPVKQSMRKLTKTSRNRLLTLSSELYCINPYVFYQAIRVVYKNR